MLKILVAEEEFKLIARGEVSESEIRRKRAVELIANG